LRSGGPLAREVRFREDSWSQADLQVLISHNAFLDRNGGMSGYSISVGLKAFSQRLKNTLLKQRSRIQWKQELSPANGPAANKRG
jgi:hypothetical protein